MNCLSGFSCNLLNFFMTAIFDSLAVSSAIPNLLSIRDQFSGRKPLTSCCEAPLLTGHGPVSVHGLSWGPLLYRLALDSPQKCPGMKPRENGGGILYSFAKAAIAKPCSLGGLNNGSVLSLLEARSSRSRCQQSCFPPWCVDGEFSLCTPMLL